MSITRQQLIIVGTVTALYWIGQLLVGTEIAVACLFSIGIFFGLLSVVTGGGLTSAYGCLNAVLIGKFLLFGVALKILMLQPADSGLLAPSTTAAVMALGFIGLFIGTTIQARIPTPAVLSINRPFSNNMLLSFSVVLFVTSYTAYFASLLPAERGEGLQTGGWIGIARALASLMSFSVIPPMLYLWRTRSRLWMTHPVILALLAWSSIVGIFSTTKQDAVEPLAFFALMGFLRYGWRDLRIWSFISLGLVYYAVIVFPYSQYVRDNGGRVGTFEQRMEVTKETFLRIATDTSFRSTVTDHVSKAGYLGSGPQASLGRLAMVGEADQLIAATERQKSFTGWETITWGFKLATPSFFYPDKPIFEAGNYLGHIAGEVGSSDYTTQISYGIMANLYNAFSFTGVLVGSVIFFAGFYYFVRMFLGDARWEGLPTASTLWFMWFIASFHHSIVESSLSGVIASLLFPVTLFAVYGISRVLSLFLPSESPSLCEFSS